MSEQSPAAAPQAHAKLAEPVSYPPPPAVPSAISTQPSIDTIEGHSGEETALSSFEEANVTGKATGRPVASRSFFFQMLFVGIVAFPQLLAEAHIGMLLVPLVDIGHQVHTEDEHQLSWFPASYGLTVGVFLIVCGRMGDL